MIAIIDQTYKRTPRGATESPVYHARNRSMLDSNQMERLP